MQIVDNREFNPELNYTPVPNGLSVSQYAGLSEEKRAEYDALDDESKQEFTYFWGFTHSEYELHIPTNSEIELYKAATDRIELKTVAQMLNFTPHKGQQPVFYTFDRQRDIVNNMVLVLGRRAQTLDSKILTPTGYTTFSDVKLNDEILDPRGGTQRVTGVHDIYDGDVYEIILRDGRVCKVDSQHLFGVTDHHSRYRVLDVEYLSKYYKASRKDSHKDGRCIEHKFKIETPLSVDYAKRDLIIPPYSLGAILGDGSISQNCTIGCNDISILNRVKEECCIKPDIRKAETQRPNYLILSLGSLKAKLTELNLYGTLSHTKFIPQEYLLAPQQDRIDLLRGLLDTDGYHSLSKNTSSAEFITTSKQLAYDVVNLVRSLGGTAKLSTKDTSYVKNNTRIQCKTAYRLYIKTPFIPFYIDRKAKDFVVQKPYNFITDIKYIGKEKVRCISVSSDHQLYLTDDYIVTHNTGKSISTSVIGVRELLVPYSSTILLTPTFNNAKIIFNEVLKHVQKLKLPIKSINKGAFRFELDNGARFSANSEANIESALGTYNSLLIVDEAQSFENLEHIMKQMLVPTLLDYGTRPSGILYGRQVYLGTPRGEHNMLFSLYNQQDEFTNWKSFNAPSTVNPILPKTYFEQMRLELGDMLYRQEILAEFIGTGDNVFWAYDPLVNTYNTGDVIFTDQIPVIGGIDVGARDSTALLLIYRTAEGNYYVDRAYSQNMTSTSKHIENYRELETHMHSKPEMRYMDPSAAQLMLDYINDYDYECVSANNAVQDSIKYINQLLTPTGANNKPKLYFNSELKELLRQVSRVRWKDAANKSSKDPFIRDTKGTHWDLIAALRYALYSDQFNVCGSIVITSSSQATTNSIYDKLKGKR